MKDAGSFPSLLQKTACGRCGKKSRLYSIEYCGHCLDSIVLKRVRTSLKAAMGKFHGQSRLMQPQSALKLNILSDDRRSLDCAVALYLVKKALAADFILNVTVASPKEAAGAGKDAINILPQCSDDIATGLIRRFISSPQTSQPHANRLPKPINILESITEKELALYAGMKRIKYEKKNKDMLQQAVEKLQEKHPGTIEAIARSVAHLTEIEEGDKK